MSGYSGQCPSCGAPIVFALGSSLLRICAHCGSAVARKGAKLEDYGKVAALIPTLSILRLGVEGRSEGEGSFSIVGHLQIDFGGGVWDEWLVDFGGDEHGWLAEAQGRFLLMRETVLPPVPAHAELAPGRTVDLGEPGTFVVTDVRTAKFVSAEGELDFAVRPGTALRYADLSGPRGLFATLDFGSADHAEALYVGREVSAASLHLQGLAGEEERRVKTESKALSCPQCGGPIELRAPDQARRVGCPWCGSLLECGERFAVLEVMHKEGPEPGIPLGSKGRIEGVEWAVIGYLERSVTVEGDLYPWREYLLYEPRAGFRWLVESDGHWSFVEPVNAGDIRRSGGSGRGAGLEYQGTRYRHFQSATARVDRVLGEFYWEVARGQQVQSADHVAPPRMLSEEKDGQELSFSLGHYLEPEAVWSAFRLKGRPPERSGVGAIQPNPHTAAFRALRPAASVLMVAALMSFIVFWARGRPVVHAQTFALGPDAEMGKAESALYSEPFSVPRRGNLQLQFEAPVDNSWLYLNGALINADTGEVREFDAELSYYHGSDWREGSRKRARYVGSVGAGRWALRLDPQWEAGKAPASFAVKVRSAVPRLHHLLLALLMVGIVPLSALWRKGRFEMRRWAESDHPLVQTE